MDRSKMFSTRGLCLKYPHTFFPLNRKKFVFYIFQIRLLKDDYKMDQNDKVLDKIVGVFDNEAQVSRTLEDLKAAGFTEQDISVIAKDHEEIERIEQETDMDTAEGMASGAATGGVLGGVAGLLIGLGALTIPGIGPILAAGPIAATFTGAIVGAGAGGLAGGLVGYGVPEEDARHYDERVNEGAILVLVDESTGRGAEIYNIFRKNNASNAQYDEM